MMRVLLADDHILVRAGLRALLTQLSMVSEIYEAGDGREAIAIVHEKHPDVTLMDVAMPIMNGFEAMSRILKEKPEARVVILSMYEDEEFVWRALRLGAAGYVAKSSAVAELEAALRAVENGEVYVSLALRTTASQEQAKKRKTKKEREAEEATAKASEAVAAPYRSTSTAIVYRPFVEPPIPCWIALVWREKAPRLVQDLVEVAQSRLELVGDQRPRCGL